MTALLDRRLLFVTGKGGVGKTVLSATIATIAAARGKRVLVADLDGRGDQRSTFGSAPLTFVARDVAPGISALSMQSEASLEEYLRLFLHLPKVARIGMLSRTLAFVANAAPGVNEILGVGKFFYELEEDNYDLVVVDAPASGHILGHLNSPQILRELTHVGLVQSQTQKMVDLLSDPVQTGAIIVATPEEMPATETLELLERFEAESLVEPAAIIVNRVLPQLFNPAERDIFDALSGDRRPEIATLVGPGTASVLDAARFAVAAREDQQVHLDRLLEVASPDLPVLVSSEVFGHDTSPALVAKVAEGLTVEVAP